MSTPRIRLFASNVHFVDTDFERLQPLAPVNSTLGKLILAVILGMLGLFVLGFWSDQEWLVVLGLLGAVVVPLVMLGVSSWLHPPAREEAYFDAEGLLLKLVPARESEPGREVRIPFAALQDLVMESKVNREGSRIHQWRQYRIRTHQEGEHPHVLINTFRPLHLVLQDLERISQLPGAAELPIRLELPREQHDALIQAER
ncbi:hypothetical protein [Metapseudomonas otitidis]|uniref:hypothetical protein n=1 Tax=Metapseudomonas otitidis TaxID=319939 RepID=UPI001CA3C9CF|nr:hypothetical protein [Pseudomonas otitidis]QZX80638.1 hypothetical protein K6751_15135 [Pseudomonas otitidis]